MEKGTKNALVVGGILAAVILVAVGIYLAVRNSGSGGDNPLSSLGTYFGQATDGTVGAIRWFENLFRGGS